MMFAAHPSVTTHDAFSPEMVTVYLAAIAALGSVVKIVTDQMDRVLRRKWEVEDRAYKEALNAKTEAAKTAAVASAKIASNASTALGQKIDSSKSERREQIATLTEAVRENTMLTQEAKEASKVALEAANGHNLKILQATEVATQALKTANETQRLQ